MLQGNINGSLDLWSITFFRSDQYLDPYQKQTDVTCVDKFVHKTFTPGPVHRNHGFEVLMKILTLLAWLLFYFLPNSSTLQPELGIGKQGTYRTLSGQEISKK